MHRPGRSSVHLVEMLERRTVGGLLLCFYRSAWGEKLVSL